MDHTKCSGNFITIAHQVLKHCNSDKKYSQFQVQGYIFYVINLESCVFMCMCEQKYSQRLAFAYLEDIRKLFTNTYDPAIIQKSNMYGLSAFSAILQEKSTLYNTPEKVDRVFELQKAVDDIMEVTMENLDKVILRGENIKLLVEKTQVMSSLSFDLKSSSSVCVE